MLSPGTTIVNGALYGSSAAVSFCLTMVRRREPP